MSFDRRDIEKNRAKAAEKTKSLESHLNSYTSALDTSLEWLTEAYSEIDRLEAENADLREQLKVKDRDIQLLSTSNEDLRRKAMIAEAEVPKLQWTPPASLRDGDYLWLSDGWLYNAHGNPVVLGRFARESFSDWTDPPRIGRWRKSGNAAEYLGQ